MALSDPLDRTIVAFPGKKLTDAETVDLRIVSLRYAIDDLAGPASRGQLGQHEKELGELLNRLAFIVSRAQIQKQYGEA